MADDEGRAQELDAQAEAVLDAVRAAVVRLLLDGGVSPQLVALGVARVAGELGASMAVADGHALERVVGELAEFTRRAGREHHELVRREGMPADAAQVPRITPSVVARRGPGRRPRRPAPACPPASNPRRVRPRLP